MILNCGICKNFSTLGLDDYVFPSLIRHILEDHYGLKPKRTKHVILSEELEKSIKKAKAEAGARAKKKKWWSR